MSRTEASIVLLTDRIFQKLHRGRKYDIFLNFVEEDQTYHAEERQRDQIPVASVIGFLRRPSVAVHCNFSLIDWIGLVDRCFGIGGYNLVVVLRTEPYAVTSTPRCLGMRLAECILPKLGKSGSLAAKHQANFSYTSEHNGIQVMTSISAKFRRKQCRTLVDAIKYGVKAATDVSRTLNLSPTKGR